MAYYTQKTKRAGALVSVLFPVQVRDPLWARRPFPKGRVFSPVRHVPGRYAQAVDKDSREALQVAKELTAKFIETRTVSPGNFAEIFPAVYGVVARAIAQSADQSAFVTDAREGNSPDDPRRNAHEDSSRKLSRRNAGGQE